MPNFQFSLLILAVAAVLAVVAVILAGGTGPGPQPLLNDSGVNASDVTNLTDANNRFAFELYSELDGANPADSNIFFSPWSISSALAMTYEGARGQTADEMQSVFHFPADASVRRPAFASLYNSINAGGKKYTLYTANALWAQKDYKFLDDYLSTVEEYYGGKTTNLDFVAETEKSRMTINDWVAGKTNDRIKDILPQGSVGEMTRLVLTNAVYFKGTWVLKFDKSDTADADFRVDSGRAVKVPMMYLHGENATFNYTENNDLQALEMAYDGGDLSMIVLLPKGDSLASIKDYLSAQKLSELRGDFREKNVVLYMPKFTFKTKYSLPDTFKKMGMKLAFEWPGADFSGMDGTNMLYITDIFHQAFVQVDEEGTEAAAATAVIIGAGTAAPVHQIVFRADHPFVFLIQERSTGNILFLGRVSDPSK
jgi:serpin B